MALLVSLLLRAERLLTIYIAVDGTADNKSKTMANGIMSEDEIIAWGKEEEAILRSNE